MTLWLTRFRVLWDAPEEMIHGDQWLIRLKICFRVLYNAPYGGSMGIQGEESLVTGIKWLCQTAATPGH